MKTSRKFATSPDILVAKEKNSVANVTVLVAISSPVKGPPSTDRLLGRLFLFWEFELLFVVI